MWLVALMLTVYCGPDLRAWVAADDDREDSELATFADEILELGEATGIAAARDRLEEVRAKLHDHQAPGAAPPPRRVPPPGSPGSPGSGDAALASGPDQATGGGGGGATKKASGPHVARKVLIIGASSIQLALGVALEDELEKLGVEVKRFGRAATGLSQPEILDWPAKLESLLDEFAADTVIINFGGNDALAIKVGKKWLKWGTEEWDAEFGGRVADLVHRVHARGGQAIVIGMPIMRSKKFSKKMLKLNQVTKDYTEQAGGLYLDQWAYSATDDGEYREEVELDGKTRLMRDKDGIHYSRWGGKYVARLLVEDMKKIVRFEAKGAQAPAEEAAPAPAAEPADNDPKNKRTGMFERRSFESEAVGGKVEYLVWRPAPRDGEDARYPVVLMLHGADAAPAAFHAALGDELTALAGELGLVLVAPDGGGHGWWLDATERRGSGYETMVAEELIAELGRTLPVSDVRGALGYSMGGHGALGLALRRPGLLRAASSLSGVVDLTNAGTRTALVARLGPLDEQRARWEAHSVIHLVREHPDRAREVALRFGCGTKDRWIDENRALHAELEKFGIAHEYEERDAGHDWTYWAAEIPAQLRWHAQQLGA